MNENSGKNKIIFIILGLILIGVIGYLAYQSMGAKNSVTPEQQVNVNLETENSELENVCTDDSYTCADGTVVKRILPDCLFTPCPEIEEVTIMPEACTDDSYTCVDGTVVKRILPDCLFAPCPQIEEETNEEMVVCTMDAMECPDGSFVGRIAPDCLFAPCPTIEE